MDLKTYSRWSNVPENLKTKTQLKEIGLKPSNINNFKAKFKSSYGTYDLFDINDCIKIKKRKVDISDIPMTDENIAEALYVINKSAKTSRDTKGFYYEDGRHDIVKRSKNRESKLYNLKDKVLNKLIEENKVEVIGTHKQIVKQKFRDKIYYLDNQIVECFDDDDFEYDHYEYVEHEKEIDQYLILYKLASFTFHRPINKSEALKYQLIGKIDDAISSHKQKTKIRFNEALKLLEKYLSENIMSKPVKPGNLTGHP